MSGWVCVDRDPMVNSQAALDLGELALTSVPALESCLSVPLLIGETLIGVVTLYASLPAAFDEEQGLLMQTVAPHISGALQFGLSRGFAANPPARHRHRAPGFPPSGPSRGQPPPSPQPAIVDPGSAMTDSPSQTTLWLAFLIFLV